MKKILTLILALAILLSLSACKSSEVKAVEELIFQIGEVTVDSESAIIKAEKAYDSLPEKDKEKVSNYNLLVDAREALQVIEITIDNWDDYFKIEKTIEDFEYEEDLFGCGLVQSASAKLNIRISKKVDCKVKNVSFDLGLLAYEDEWMSYDNLEHVTLTEDGSYEGSFTVRLKDDAALFTFMLNENPGFSVLLPNLKGSVIIVSE